MIGGRAIPAEYALPLGLLAAPIRPWGARLLAAPIHLARFAHMYALLPSNIYPRCLTSYFMVMIRKCGIVSQVARLSTLHNIIQSDSQRVRIIAIPRTIRQPARAHHSYPPYNPTASACASRTSAGYRQERLKGAILVTGSVEAERETGSVRKHK